MATEGPDHGELDRVRTRVVSGLLRELDPVIVRVLELAKFELIHERAELLAELPDRLAALPDDAVTAAAGRLRDSGQPCSSSSPGAAMTATTAHAVPELTRPRRPRKNSVAERTIASGLRIVAVRKAGVPLVEQPGCVPVLGSGTTHRPRKSVGGHHAHRCRRL